MATQPPTLLNSRESGSWPVVYPLSPSWGERNAIVKEATLYIIHTTNIQIQREPHQANVTTVVEEACKNLGGGGGAEVLSF